jgi:hypothetical protein
MRLGITGTREGMTAAQRQFFRDFLKVTQVNAFHFGDCVGVDDQAADLVSRMKNAELPEKPLIVCHPPASDSLRAFNKNADSTLPAKTYEERNRDIVNACDLLVVVPKQEQIAASGGTWQTYDYGVEIGKPILIIWPNGSCTWPDGETT